MGLFVDFIMLHNIKPLSLHRVFHGIRFKVNEDWESGKIPFFYVLFQEVKSEQILHFSLSIISFFFSLSPG